MTILSQKPVLTPEERLCQGCLPTDLTNEEMKQVVSDMMKDLDKWGGLPPPNLIVANLEEEEDNDDDEEEEDEGEVLNQLIYWDIAKHGVRIFDSCLALELDGKYGHSTLFYLISKRAVEATMKVSLTTPDGDVRNVGGKIVAYYGNFDYDCRPDELEYFKATLFESESAALLETGEIPLKRFVMAVPYKCSLIIEARILDESGEEIFNDFHEFPAQLKDSNSERIKGNKGCHLVLNVDWNYETFAHDYDVL